MSLSRRIAKIEASRNPPKPPPPRILEVDTFNGETMAEARVRFERRWGPIPKGHKFLVVPKSPTTADEHAEWERRLYQQQTELRASSYSPRADQKDHAK